jgi:hypothetical protein
MQIEITQAEQQRLIRLASAAGYEDVEQFVADHVSVLSQQPTPEELPLLSPGELEESLAMCDRGMAEIDAGGGREAREALLEIGRKRGFNLGE